jgi:hypothetical protein
MSNLAVDELKGDILSEISNCNTKRCQACGIHFHDRMKSEPDWSLRQFMFAPTRGEMQIKPADPKPVPEISVKVARKSRRVLPEMKLLSR